MNIAIIPARKNSQRIKNKNIKIFNGKPIIFWSIKTALKSKLFKDIFVSTDSKKLLNTQLNMVQKYCIQDHQNYLTHTQQL